MSCARRFAAACSRANAAFDGALPLLERMPVSSSARSARDEGARPDALFMSLDEAAELPACSCAALVLCDLDAGSYPVRLVDDGGTLLLEKPGPRPPRRRARRLRRRFFRALSSACETVVCERVLNTEDANAGVSVGHVRGAAQLLPGSGCGRGRPGDGASQAARRLRHAGRGGRAATTTSRSSARVCSRA